MTTSTPTRSSSPAARDRQLSSWRSLGASVVLAFAAFAGALHGQVFSGGTLVGHWRFDEGSGSTAIDTSGSNNGTLFQGPVWTTDTPPSCFGGAYALAFDGISSNVNVPDNSSLDITSWITLAAWVKPTGSSLLLSTQGIISKPRSVGGGTGWALRVEDGRLNLGLNDNYVNYSVHSPTTLPLNEWTHIAASYSVYTTTVKLWVNGVLVKTDSSFPLGPLVSSDSPLYIGKELANSTGIPRVFRGLIDDARIYNRELADAEVAWLADPMWIAEPSGVVAWLPGDNNALDVATGVDAQTSTGLTYTTGQVDKAFRFDGVNGYVSHVTAASQPVQGMTAEMWVRVDESATTFAGRSQPILAKAYSTAGGLSRGWRISVNGTTRALSLDLGAGAAPVTLTGGTLPLGEWAHVAANVSTANGSSMLRLYLNGREVTSMFTTTALQWAPAGTPLVLQSESDSTKRFLGRIDEFRLFNRALSAQEIHRLFHAGCAGVFKDTTAPVIAASNVTVSADPASCAATVNFVTLANVTVTDENPVFVSYSPASGSSFPLGTTNVTCTAMDTFGNIASKTFTVTVKDVTAPSVTLNGAGTITIECHSTFTDPGATAFDACSGSRPVTVTGGVNSSVIGTYVLTYRAQDTSGNIGTTSRTVKVVDTMAPVVTLNGAAAITIDCHTTFVDPGASALDECAGMLPVTIVGAPNTAVPGVYTITYKAQDPSGNIGRATRTVTVVDSTAPAIALNGAATITVEARATFTDPGATALDDCAGSVPVSVTGTVNTSALGSYTLTYTAVDPSGNTATATRTVKVVDTTAPAVTLNGAATLTLECHTAFADPGASALDAFAGAVAVTVSGSINTLVPGTYTLTYSAADPSGNVGTATRTVRVVDTVAPVITLNGGAALVVPFRSVFADPGATAFDECAGNVAVSVAGAVNTSALGTYTLAYTAVDPSGNAATVSRTVRVVDVTAPVIVLTGDAVLTVECHTPFADPGALAVDDSAGAVPVTVSGSVDTTTLGSFTLTYSAVDPSGNVASLTRTVRVVDTTAPVVTLNTAATITIACHTSFVDAGASALDACAGALPVVVSGAVNPDAVGTYTLTYTATDPSGNTGTATRTVHVVNTPPSFVSVTGPAGPLALGSTATVAITIADVDVGQAHRLTIAWDDGVNQTLDLAPGVTSVTASHTYAAAGVNTLRLTVDDGCATATTVHEFIVIYDANGGFVTGGGWINSPAGAVTGNPAATGKATFGFVSKYLPGTNVPSGNTEFQFQAAGIRFKSTAYDWLVVAGARAQYKGTGTFNAIADCQFLLTATDGDAAGGGGVDKFRLKITKDGGVLYDNNPGGSDDLDNANPQAIGGGSIQIKK